MREYRMGHPNDRADLRGTASTTAPRLAGLAAVFNQPTEIGGSFIELIAPRAFRDVLTSDVVCLFNHDASHVLGRTTNHTLRLEETDRGLAFACDINSEDAGALALYARIVRGDITGCSFSFTVAEEDWQYPREGLPVRTILKVARVFDCGPVTFPAYDGTAVQALDGRTRTRGPEHHSVQLARERLRWMLRA